jgi:hypothetical protein
VAKLKISNEQITEHVTSAKGDCLKEQFLEHVIFNIKYCVCLGKRILKIILKGMGKSLSN